MIVNNNTQAKQAQNFGQLKYASPKVQQEVEEYLAKKSIRTIEKFNGTFTKVSMAQADNTEKDIVITGIVRHVIGNIGDKDLRIGGGIAAGIAKAGKSPSETYVRGIWGSEGRVLKKLSKILLGEKKKESYVKYSGTYTPPKANNATSHSNGGKGMRK